MKRFDTREAARIVALPERRIRACVRAGCLTPQRDADGRYSFGFRDLSVLRTARRLLDSGLPASRVARALGTLRRQLPDDAHLSSVTIRADGRRLVASDGDSQWEPDSGQLVLDFEERTGEVAIASLTVASDRAPVGLATREAATGSGPLRVVSAGRAATRDVPAGDAPARLTPPPPPHDESDARTWFETGCELEASSPLEARAAYERALELDPELVEAHLNLGRLHHQTGELGKAEARYREAVHLAPHDAVPHFNLGVLLEERGRRDEAVYAYRQAIARAPEFADAHYNLSLVCEALGKRSEALAHMMEAKRLYEEDGG